ncbi:hypothetical protein K438DRAFT_1995765 [Mycena galopus ATCC 62051]|nr:hypothetical protein K438DRAFT_1995765 [Mycena galopus ATCC 62051]
MSGGIGSSPELDRTARASESDRTEGDGGERSPERREVTFRVEAQAEVRVRRPDSRARPDGRTGPDEGSDEAVGQPAPLEAYIEAARDSTRTLATLIVYKKFLATCGGEEDADSRIGKHFIYIEFVNPFKCYDPRRVALDNASTSSSSLDASVACFRNMPVDDLDSTLERTNVVFKLKNKFWAQPTSTRCCRRYFLYQLWADGLAALQKDAETKVLADEKDMDI